MAPEFPVYFDGRWNGPHGIGRFSLELQSRIRGIVPLDITGPKLSIIDPLAISWALRDKKAGCHFSPGFNPPLRSPIPVVFTIHDLIHLQVPQESTLVRRTYYACVVRPAARRAAKVLTVSEFSRQQIIEWAGMDPAKVVVVGNGVSPAFRPPAQALPPTHFLHVGRRGAHKNIQRLLQAYSRCESKLLYPLIFTATPDRATLAQADALGLRDRIRFAGHPDDAGLAALYHRAAALLFPSTFEGFGLPIIEAMACGTPVITASTTSTAEVGGEAALLIDPFDVESLAHAIDRVTHDRALHQRLALAGPKRASLFSWDRVTTRVTHALQEAM